MSLDLNSIFTSEYSPENWRKVLAVLFANKNFFLTPVEHKDPSLAKHNSVQSILELGDIHLGDKSRIVFYEVELGDGKSVESRVELRNLIHTEVIPGDVDGIIATYYHKKSKNWRLTFISKSLYWDEEMKEIKNETHPKRYTYVLGEKESVKTALKQFDWLLHQIRSREISINDLIKTFAVEKISKEFFDGYKHQFETFEAYIADNPEAFSFFKQQVQTTISADEQQKEAERHIRNFVKKLLGRIVFLYFLQKKGWLGVPAGKDWGEGERDFMTLLFKNFGDKANFYPLCLVPLFFKTLNQKRPDDIFEVTNTKVPYLNGGLFDKDKIEPELIKFNPRLFEDLFEFFSQYNFTIDENSPDDLDIGIDPEMLGLIFENLLEDNRDKGTFYTPKEVVHFMCKESLSLHIKQELKNKATPEELKEIDIYIKNPGIVNLEIIKKHAQDIDTILSQVKICDPAIGSGAFPMGMVYEILRLKKELFGISPRPSSFNYRTEKLKIIRESIYGVDLDKGAVDIARLRFWLSLIVDEEEPAPLPNLDYKIMQGDSLKEFFEGIPLDQNTMSHKITEYSAPQLTLMGDGFDKIQKEIEFNTSEKDQLQTWVKQYFKENNHDEKEKLHKGIDAKVLEHIGRNVELKENQVIRLKNEIEQKYARAGVKIGEQINTKGKDFKTWKSLVKELEEVNRKKCILEKLESRDERPYFLWHLFFSDVLTEGKNGFDIVIGNPPYGVKVEDEIKDMYKLGSKDSYGAFMAMAMQKLLKDNGVLSFIVSDTWLTIKTHFELRQQVLAYQLKKIIRLHQDCFKATVNSCIFTLLKQKAEHAPENIIAADLTNISTRKEVPEFREKLSNLEIFSGESTPKFAVYSYPQNLLSTNSNKPLIVGSPKLFQLMNDKFTLKERIQARKNNIENIEVRKLEFNNSELFLLRFGDIATVKHGLTTGDNYSYLYKEESARGNYNIVNKELILEEKDYCLLSDEEKKKGFSSSKFNRKFLLRYDKGGASDTDEGWLPNYFVPTEYYIDWRVESVTKMMSLIGHRHDNPDYYFKEGITFSSRGIYSPTFRINTPGPFDKESSCIFCKIDRNELLGVLNSKFNRFLFRNYIIHTVSSEVDTIKEMIIPYYSFDKLKYLVGSIINSQSKNLKYNYFDNEQKEIDRLVYELYGLNEDDINEVETWFARRYPRLAAYAYYKTPAELKVLTEAEPLQKQVLEHIKTGEGRTVEFKSSLRYCLRQKSPQRYVEHSSFKNLAAFLNTEGGSLLIGVEDNGNIIGLEDTDYLTFNGDNKKDEFLKHFDNLVEKYFGNALAGKFKVEFTCIDGKTVALVTVKDRAPEPVILKNPENNKEEFYIRRNASAKDLTMFEFFQYAKEHWKE